MGTQYEEGVDHIVSGCESLAQTEYFSRQSNAAYLIGASVKIMIQRLQTYGTNTSQRL